MTGKYEMLTECKRSIQEQYEMVQHLNKRQQIQINVEQEVAFWGIESIVCDSRFVLI